MDVKEKVTRKFDSLMQEGQKILKDNGWDGRKWYNHPSEPLAKVLENTSSIVIRGRFFGFFTFYRLSFSDQVLWFVFSPVFRQT